MKPFGVGANELRQLGIDDSKLMKAGTRPGEVGGSLAESSFHRVGVNVVDGGTDSSKRKHIPIKTGSLLPKPKAGLAGPFHHREFVQLR